MALVYASDVKHDGEYVRKRGDAFKKADAKDLFDLEDATSLIDDGIVVHETALPENRGDESNSLSYNELEAEMRRKNEEHGVTPESSDAGSLAKAPLQAQALPPVKDKEDSK